MFQEDILLVESMIRRIVKEEIALASKKEEPTSAPPAVPKVTAKVEKIVVPVPEKPIT